ncbi:DUF6364 family protein [Flavobacterium macrobrachii]|jgi:hypothetical protein|uniref:DUF6364 family protein n=1 Tax=Flavobacterium macrobrachii TaxID=591204 RepID=UPI0037C094CE
MKEKIVIVTDKQTIIDAKKIARSKNISLSKMFENYLKDLVDGKTRLLINKNNQ